jgi:hypothetical protein
MAGAHHEAAARVARGEGAQLAVDVLKDHRRPRREQHPRRRVFIWRAVGLVAASRATAAATLDDCTPQKRHKVVGVSPIAVVGVDQRIVAPDERLPGDQ